MGQSTFKENPRGHRDAQTRTRNRARKQYRLEYTRLTGRACGKRLNRWPLPDLPGGDESCG